MLPKTNKKVGLEAFLRERFIVTSSILCFKKVFLATMKRPGWQGLSYAAKELFEQRGTGNLAWGGKMNSKLSMDSKDIQKVKLTGSSSAEPGESVRRHWQRNRSVKTDAKFSAGHAEWEASWS